MLNHLVAWSLPIIPRFIVAAVAKRYIAGETRDDAVRVIRELNSKGMRATVDALGEFITDLHQAQSMRVYVPFGKEWYGYSVRRLKENPQMAGYVFKAMFGIGQ